MPILWVENHARFVSAVRQFLSGHEVAVVPAVERAISKLESATFDAILVDHDVDDGTGVEVLA